MGIWIFKRACANNNAKMPIIAIKSYSAVVYFSVEFFLITYLQFAINPYQERVLTVLPITCPL